MKVIAVSVGRAVRHNIKNFIELTAIDKNAVDGPVAVRPLGLEGDEQADLTLHGGLSKAVYAYPIEHHAFWRTVRAQARVSPWATPLRPGSLGENLTLEGLTEDRLWIGDRLCLPGCVLVVSEPRRPCHKLNAALGFDHAAKLMIESGYCGFYLAVLEGGTLQAGDPIELRPGPREVNLRELFRARTGTAR